MSDNQKLTSLSLSPVLDWSRSLRTTVGGEIDFGYYLHKEENVSCDDIGMRDMDICTHEENRRIGGGMQILTAPDGSRTAARLMLTSPLTFERFQFNTRLYAEGGHDESYFGGGGLMVGGRLFLLPPLEDRTSPFVLLGAFGKLGLSSHSSGLLDVGGYVLAAVGMAL